MATPILWHSTHSFAPLRRLIELESGQLLKDVKEDLKEIKDQLRAITISLEKKSSCKSDNEGQEEIDHEEIFLFVDYDRPSRST
eukprot:scaffold94862_cov41-Attheya_sp.AAC.1